MPWWDNALYDTCSLITLDKLLLDHPELAHHFRHVVALEASFSADQLRETVVFQKWRWPYLHCPSKGIPVYKQANDKVVHLCGFRKADGLTHQAFDARP